MALPAAVTSGRAQEAAERASWIVEQEARALLTRLDRVKPFVLQETMVPAAAPMPAAQVAIDRYLMAGRRALRGRVLEFLRWIDGPGRAAPPPDQQRRFVILKLQFNAALSQLDLFAEAIGQRSEGDTGVWLAGLDVAAQDALELPGGHFEPPPVVCHLHRGLGGAIRRARTRLPGGGETPVALVRIPRERMIGYGIASSLAHEVGHQAAALLRLVESLRAAIQRVARSRREDARTPWKLWERWISEIVADLWAIGRVGISSTLGLIGIVSLPRPFVFRVNVDDPHPFAWIRVRLSCALGDALYPHRQWRALAESWNALYPPARLERDGGNTDLLERLVAEIPGLVHLLLGHRPPSLGGKTLGDAIWMADRDPDALSAIQRRWREEPALMWGARPTLAFAVLGRARIAGALTPEEEGNLLGELIRHWALHGTLEALARSGPTPTRPQGRPENGTTMLAATRAAMGAATVAGN
jgi:hypothetical protein